MMLTPVTRQIVVNIVKAQGAIDENRPPRCSWLSEFTYDPNHESNRVTILGGNFALKVNIRTGRDFIGHLDLHSAVGS